MDFFHNLSNFLRRETLRISHTPLTPSSVHQRGSLHLRGAETSAQEPKAGGEQEDVLTHRWVVEKRGRASKHRSCRIHGNRSLHTNFRTRYKLRHKITLSCIGSIAKIPRLSLEINIIDKYWPIICKHHILLHHKTHPYYKYEHHIRSYDPEPATLYYFKGNVSYQPPRIAAPRLGAHVKEDQDH